MGEQHCDRTRARNTCALPTQSLLVPHGMTSSWQGWGTCPVGGHLLCHTLGPEHTITHSPLDVG